MRTGRIRVVSLGTHKESRHFKASSPIAFNHHQRFASGVAEAETNPLD